jgi:hypothetical protein
VTGRLSLVSFEVPLPLLVEVGELNADLVEIVGPQRFPYAIERVDGPLFLLSHGLVDLGPLRKSLRVVNGNATFSHSRAPRCQVEQVEESLRAGGVSHFFSGAGCDPCEHECVGIDENCDGAVDEPPETCRPEERCGLDGRWFRCVPTRP